MSLARRPRLAFILACSFMLAGSAGCSDDDSAGNNNVVDAAVDAAEDGGTGVSMTFIVMTPVDATDVPVEGATVAFDAPGGERTEQVTPADGRVTFDNIDWSLGQAAVTAHLLGYSLISVVNLDATTFGPEYMIDGALVLPIYDLEPDLPGEVTVTGSATGLVDPAHNYSVAPLFSFVGTGDFDISGNGSYSITAPSGEPFTILAYEVEIVMLSGGRGYEMTIYRAMHQNIDPITSNAVIDLDFAALEVPTYTADASMYLPTRAASPLRSGNGIALVCAQNSNYCFGWGAHVDVSADNNYFNITTIWTEPTLAENPFAYYYVYDRLSGERSMALISGYPQGGLVNPPLFDVPAWVTPSHPSTVHPIHDPMEWEWFDADVPSTGVRIIRNNVIVWFVASGPNATSTTVPQPPTGITTSSILGPNPTAVIYGGTADPDFGWTRLVLSRPQRISP